VSKLEELTKRALALSEEDRLWLAEELLKSLYKETLDDTVG
jgi:hypothetical protein